jgi:glycosyltransferase involved in cell wall biosynthesis
MLYPFHVDIQGLFVNKLLKNSEKEFDVLHAHNPLVPAVKTHLPIVATFHTPNFRDAFYTPIVDARHLLIKFLGVIDYRIEKSLISSSRVISTVSNGVKLDLLSYYPIKLRPVMVFGNAVSDKFLKERYSFAKKDDLRIIYVGRLEHQKGLLDLVESMKFVSRRIPDAKLVLVGKGPLKMKLIKRINELQLQKQVDLVGYHSREDVLADCQLASIFVSASYFEGLPTTLLEAMACENAVVATNVRGNSELVKHGETGLLVPKCEPRLLGEAILNLLEHPNLRGKLASNARKLIEENYTWDKVTDRVLEAYSVAMR